MRLIRVRPSVPLGGRMIGRGVTAIATLTALTLAVQAVPSAQLPAADGSTTAAPTVSVQGSIPYMPDAGETAVTPLSASCSRLYKGFDLALYVSELAAFKADRAPDAANLLAHWFAGSGQPVNYGANSVLATKAAAFPAFQVMNSKVQAFVGQRLGEGTTNITVPTNQGYSPTSQRPLVLLNFNDVVNFPALYWAFRATQGIKVTGTIRDTGGRYSGELTYVISDTYGFRANDTSSLTGPFTRAMNYLQTNCGHPKYTAGPLWFSDTLTVPVKFSAAGGQ
jgi:hypothetical protein